MNKESNKVNQWLIYNKLSLNTEKTKYSLFHKPSPTENLALILPTLKINDKVIERV